MYSIALYAKGKRQQVAAAAIRSARTVLDQYCSIVATASTTVCVRVHSCSVCQRSVEQSPTDCLELELMPLPPFRWSEVLTYCTDDVLLLLITSYKLNCTRSSSLMQNKQFCSVLLYCIFLFQLNLLLLFSRHHTSHSGCIYCLNFLAPIA